MQEHNRKRVYDVSDIQIILGLGRSNVYKFLESVFRKQDPFKVIKVGKLYKVPREPFDNWVNGSINNDI